MCCLPIFGIRSLYFRAPHNTLLQERLLFFHLLSVEPYEGPWNTEKSLSLTVPLSVLISAFLSLLLSLSPLQHLHSQSWLQGAWRRNQNSALICHFCGTLGRQHGMCPRDGCNGCTFSLSWIWNNQRRHSSIHLREQKPGAKYIFWFYGCTNPQKLNGKELGRSGRWSNCFRLPAWLLLGTGYMCQFVWVI